MSAAGPSFLKLRASSCFQAQPSQANLNLQQLETAEAVWLANRPKDNSLPHLFKRSMILPHRLSAFPAPALQHPQHCPHNDLSNIVS